MTSKPRYNFADTLRATRDKMEDRFVATMSSADDVFDASGLLESIKNQLIKDRREIVLKLLGFTNRFGELELEHPSRNSATAIQKHIEASITAAAEKFLADNPDFFSSLVEEVMKKPGIKTAVRKRFTDVFEYRIREEAERAARDLATEEGQKLAQEARKALSLRSAED